MAIAKDAGFDVTLDDLNNYQVSQGPITTEELAAISGGKGMSDGDWVQLYEEMFGPLPVAKNPANKP